MDEEREHDLACALLTGYCAHYGLRSVLDVGSGTGRALSYLSANLPDLRLVGIEPVEALREQGYKRGLSRDILVDGNGMQIPFADQSFDVAIALGVLHHVATPRTMIQEMLRVSTHAVFISDSNRFAQGTWLARRTKRVLYQLGLWRMVDSIKTRGRHYSYSEGDGITYSYSVFDDMDLLRRRSSSIHVTNLDGAGANPITAAPHLAILALKQRRGPDTP